MRDRVPGWMPRVLFESALIVFSVLLALVLNEWRQSQMERAGIAQATAAIRSELQENRRLVEEALQYHPRLAESFTASSKSGAETPVLSDIDRGLLHPGRVLRTAWESAQSSGATSRMDYMTLLRLSTAYSLQEEYEQLTRAMQQAAYDQILREGFDSMIRKYPRFIMVQRDFAGHEQELLRLYDQALAALP
jgi:hypothetical protein